MNRPSYVNTPPSSSPSAGGVTGARSKRAVFINDGGEPSAILAHALENFGDVSRDLLRDAAPFQDAVLFLHNVTGLTDIALSEDRFYRTTGIRARGRKGAEPVFIVLYFRGA